ncbi:hypothetical protein PPYR_12354 [Photinus pyralis]|uniref:LRRCT domain-containing protein n=3 Tax=Photinus pyralis TaxID=7054 RepID=A0A5N4ADY8_PHOPY|nr:hypothetical protein PPYR_12348 [Photinus pyralis]KAB0795515.1 hypothetical protein PPYR_12354 [Photinus pyralis]
MSIQCEVPSFKNNIIVANGDTPTTISGCISPDTIGFTSIFRISAENQAIQDLNHGAVQGISSKFEIDFHNTSVEIIREGAFLDLPQLIRIYFMENELFWISESAFRNLPLLTEVHLEHNKITDVSPRAFNNLPNLTTVSLERNKLENCDQSWFYKTPVLQSLNLGENRLRKIPRAAFINLPSIQRLYLDLNQIEIVDKNAFMGLRNLKRLDLSDNKLKSFEFNFYAPSKLTFVSINNNNITYISDEVLDVIRPQLSELIIVDNPLQCACLEKIIKWSDTFNISVPQWEFEQSGAVCTVPKRKPSQCLERGDDDFEEGFWVSFVRERIHVVK